MEDLKLTTKVTLGTPAVPPQPGNPTEFFGQSSNDLQLSTLNDFAVVTGLTKLKQDINKILLTVRGTNTLFSLYGTELQTLIGGKSNFDFVKAKIKDEVITALRVLQFINKTNPDLDEQIETLESLRIEQVEVDQVFVELSVITVSGKRITDGIIIA